MNVKLSPSQWSVSEARSLIAQLRQLAEGDAYDGIELFAALCEYLDQLYGGTGFDELLPEPQATELGGLIRSVVSTTPLDPDGDPLDRLDQPVNSAVTLAEGRRLAAYLATADDWQGELGRALQGLYSYLDHLSGGPGTFVRLLTREEREQVAARAPKR
ncbi:hypothetical protein GCM10009554_41340 [Kribbella koreensis]|uniref:Uncharacterized protein n=1 Tax=Kribbella koreensis TaxID=57909 RepID=A0ABP4B4G4_9ACTN